MCWLLCQHRWSEALGQNGFLSDHLSLCGKLGPWASICLHNMYLSPSSVLARLLCYRASSFSGLGVAYELQLASYGQRTVSKDASRARLLTAHEHVHGPYSSLPGAQGTKVWFHWGASTVYTHHGILEHNLQVHAHVHVCYRDMCMYMHRCVQVHAQVCVQVHVHAHAKLGHQHGACTVGPQHKCMHMYTHLCMYMYGTCTCMHMYMPL